MAFKNDLRVAFRNLWRQKGFSLLNIIGLAVGMTAFFLIFLYVCFELSYDSFHGKAGCASYGRSAARGGGGGRMRRGMQHSGENNVVGV